MNQQLSRIIVFVCAMVLCNAARVSGMDWLQPAQVTALVAKSDFDALEDLEFKLRTEKSRTPAGRWELHEFYSGAGSVKHVAKVEAWKKAKPESVAPRIALASIYRQQAWHARGSGYADSVTEQMWTEFHRLLKLAWKELIEAEKLAEKDPELYVLRIITAMGMDKSKEDILAILDKGVGLEPGYYDLYEAAAIALLPRWGGEVGDVERLAREMMPRTQSTDGDGLYARIAMVSMNYVGVDEFILEMQFEWPLLRKSFYDLRERFPNSNHIPNQFCRFAGYHNDKEAAREMFGVIAANPDKAMWGGDEPFARWQAWALKDGPFPGLDELMIAVVTNDIEKTKSLLDAGAEVDTVNGSGEPILLMAFDLKRDEMIELLIERGADLNLTDASGFTPLYHAAVAGRWDYVRLMLEKGADASSAVDSGWTPLMVAAQDGSLEGIRLLCSEKVNLNAQNDEGWTALLLAASQSRSEAVLLLLEQANIDVTLINKQKENALHWAARSCSIEVVQRLLELGLDPMTRSIYGTTAIGDARLAKRADVEELLRKASEKAK